MIPESTTVKKSPKEHSLNVSDSLLGNTTKSASTSNLNPQISAMINRYYLQALARELMPDHRVCVCCRYLSHNAENVKVVWREKKKIASYKGLSRCGALWVCSVCGAVISEQRKSELKRASHRWHGDIIMLSYTLRHNHYSKLPELLEILETSYRRFNAGRFMNDLRKEFGIIGSVKALEVTHKTGWHPHIHQMVFLDKINGVDLESITDDLKKRWVRILSESGGSCTYKTGLDVKKDADFLAAYIAKFGKTPTRELWSIEHELTKGNVKLGKQDGKTPMQLLADYGDGDKRAGYLFQEFAYNFFGRKQLIWTRGLKERLEVDVLTDEEAIEQDEQDGNFTVLATLTGHEWRRVREQSLQAALLAAAYSGDEMTVKTFLKDHYITGGGE